MKDFHETALNYLVEDEHMTFCTCEKKWINKIHSLAEQYPSKVEITDEPESNHGYIVAHLPKNWFTVRAPRTEKMTEEQRKELSARMCKNRPITG